MEEGKVVLSIEEYRQLIEKANFNEMVYREMLNSRNDLQHTHDKMYELERRLNDVEMKLRK